MTTINNCCTAAPLRPALGLALLTLLFCGFGYALLGTSLGYLLFPAAASGSLIAYEGNIVGSALLAQPFANAGYFQARPSASAYDPMAMSGSNLARSNPALAQRIAAERSSLAQREGIAPSALPPELLTQSGSGNDPHLSPAAVAVQIARVAQARGLALATVTELVTQHTAGRQFGLFGEPRINVLQLNLALDAAHGRPR